ncbi:preprotein translocase subunit SecG [Chelativorans sp. AA-79]|uniref:preprotein translocase subunit SecG n=1 Tax=Chelativorans sp. AA-79 TaxID=3028735 RepID=UPI0023F94063|nr:preprotein translocase subunit SecG [Chelativorans sp. AA-79]WEX07151.1 preprotein translocase subunit SecG [Chelativorans sp. AA-79]
MQTIIIVIHLLIVVALVGVVLMQRSEGGGLGIGGGSGFMTARGAANALTRTTAILAAAFFATSLALSIYARYQERPTDIFDRLPQDQTQPEGTGGGILDQLGGSTPPAPSEEQSPPAQTAPAPAEPQSAPAGGQTAPAPAEPQAAPSGQSSAPASQSANPESQVPTGQ